MWLAANTLRNNFNKRYELIKLLLDEGADICLAANSLNTIINRDMMAKTLIYAKIPDGYETYRQCLNNSL